MTPSGKNKKILLLLLAFVVLMIGVAYASVPLYRLFCKATGFNGTTQRVESAPAQPLSTATPEKRWITITFDSNVDSALPWEFGPDQRSIRIAVGDVTNITYHARNKGKEAMVGTATFNVQPDKIGSYFDKIQCFCFTKQVLQPGESVTLPVQFYIDPAIFKDKNADDVQNITLSYTFFRAKDQSAAQTPAPSMPASGHDMSSMPPQPAGKKP